MKPWYPYLLLNTYCRYSISIHKSFIVTYQWSVIFHSSTFSPVIYSPLWVYSRKITSCNLNSTLPLTVSESKVWSWQFPESQCDSIEGGSTIVGCFLITQLYNQPRKNKGWEKQSTSQNTQCMFGLWAREKCRQQYVALQEHPLPSFPYSWSFMF